MSAPAPQFDAVPPSDSVKGIQNMDGVVHATACHRRDGRCEAVYVVDALPVALGLWQRAPDWKAPGRVRRATSLTHVGQVWQAHVSWRPRPNQPEVVGIVLCIVPKGSTTWFMQPPETLINPSPETTSAQGSIPPAHLRAIEDAFIEEEKGIKLAWFSGAVMSAGHAPQPSRERNTAAPLLTLYLAACQYPAGMLELTRQVRSANLLAPANEVGPGERALKRLACKRLDDLQQNRLATHLLLSGDEVYVDATAGLFDPRMQDAPWDRSWDTRNDNPWIKTISQGGASLDILDDHEIVDNWEPSYNPARNAALHEIMYRGRSRFMRRSNWAAFSGWNPNSDDRRLWFSTWLDGHFLFAGNTRTERDARDSAGLMAAHIMGDEQRCELKKGLLDANEANKDTWKLIATPSMLLPRPLALADEHTPEPALRCDSWCGYPATLYELLAHIADAEIDRCVFLSGDEHLPSLTNIDVQRVDVPDQPMLTIRSIHAGALYAPYPFANSKPEDFIEDDLFEFEQDQRRYRCTVRALFPPIHHEGYIQITLGSDAPSSRVRFRNPLACNEDPDAPKDAHYDLNGREAAPD